ncbi:hypothetical protein O6H91_Y236700 [Diphasiastrum complanatum]|nr:hypothetical protein O6H91_Y236700 [Diphasiastrum complanatum]
MGDPPSGGVFRLAAAARKLDVDNSLPLKVYYRTADNLLKQASIYRKENSITDLYILLLRFSSLVSETIPEHHDYKKLFLEERNYYRRKLVEVINELELLKPEVKRQLEQHNVPALKSYSSGVEWPPNTQRSSVSKFNEQKDIQSYGSSNKQVFSSTGGGTTALSSEFNQSNESSLKSLRIPRANDETLARHSFLASIGKTKLNLLRSAPIHYPNSIEASPNETPSYTQSLSLCIPPSSAGAKRNTFSPESSLDPSRWLDSDLTPQGRPFSVDQLADKFPHWDPFNQPFPPPVAAPVQSAPASFDYYSTIATHSNPPLIGINEATGVLQDDATGRKAPKQLHVSLKMMEEFLQVAKLNTQKNLETCGVLSGYLEKGIFHVTTLIIPKQESTSDSCQTVNEEEIFDIQDKRSLFQLGWIHTHPSQSCFMSSIDLHTHYSYQIMLQEAIAIVMAPTDTTRLVL